MSDELRRIRRSYRPGEWYAVLGDRATVLLPPSQRSRVADLWLLLDDGAGFDDALDALIATGLRGLSGFVLVSEADGETRILLRGAARAVLSGADGDVELEGSAATTWVERSVRGVSRLVVEVGAADGAARAPDGEPVEELCTDGGLARVSRIEQPPAPRPEPVAEPRPEPVEEPRPEPVEELRPAPVADWSPAPVPPASYDDAPTEAISLAARGLEADDEAADRITDRFPEHEHGDRDDRPVARLAFSSGERVDVDRVVLVGRAPEARGFAAHEQPRLVTVRSPHQEVSSTHLEVRPGTGPDRGSAVATDLGSTNGTVLLQPGREAMDLRAGLAERLLPGAVLDLGDGVTIRVSDD